VIAQVVTEPRGLGIRGMPRDGVGSACGREAAFLEVRQDGRGAEVLGERCGVCDLTLDGQDVAGISRGLAGRMKGHAREPWGEVGSFIPATAPCGEPVTPGLTRMQGADEPCDIVPPHRNPTP